jgi:hypothetical protein
MRKLWGPLYSLKLRPVFLDRNGPLFCDARAMLNRDGRLSPRNERPGSLVRLWGMNSNFPDGLLV